MFLAVGNFREFLVNDDGGTSCVDSVEAKGVADYEDACSMVTKLITVNLFVI